MEPYIPKNRWCGVPTVLRRAPLVPLFLIMVVLTAHVRSQQDSRYTQYMYNTQVFNPAYAGTKGMPGFTLLYGSQWVGLNGAPENINFVMDAPVGKQKEMGLGLAFITDRIGPSDESTITGDFSYILRLNDKVKMAFGLKGGVNLLNVDYGKLRIFNPNDALLQFNVDNRLTPIIGAGVYFYGQETWYMGLSVPNLLETTHYDDKTVSNASERAVVYGIMGYVFNMGGTKFKPAILGKYVSGAPLAIDLSANFLLNDRLTLGAAYGFDAAVSGLVGFQVTNRCMIGYAYDYGIHDLAHYHSGSHEIFMRFDIGGPTDQKIVTPRFF